MNPVTLLFRLPLLPMQGVIKLAQIIDDEAERQLRDPAMVRRQLEEAEAARERGEASDEDVARIEEQTVGRLVGSGSRPRVGSDGEGS